MSVVLAWFADRLMSAQEREQLDQRREQALAPLIPDSYERHATGGDDWGVLALHPPYGEVWRWSVMAQDANVTAVSIGLPIGIDVRGGPLQLARRVLGDEDVHARVLPPFGLLAIEGSSRAVIQQDWLGMCRIFTAEARGITVFATRPSLVAQFLGLPLVADIDGWTSYTLCGHFGGVRSPIQGVRLLDPGQRTTMQRSESGGWASTVEHRRDVGDVIANGIALRDAGVDAALDVAATAVADMVRTAADLVVGDITIGLSGGKDSRVIAAALVAAKRIPTSRRTTTSQPKERRPRVCWRCCAKSVASRHNTGSTRRATPPSSIASACGNVLSVHSGSTTTSSRPRTSCERRVRSAWARFRDRCRSPAPAANWRRVTGIRR